MEDVIRKGKGAGRTEVSGNGGYISQDKLVGIWAVSRQFEAGGESADFGYINKWGESCWVSVE